MSYHLLLEFEPPVPKPDFLRFFSERANYRVEGNDIRYGNEETGVYFNLHYRCRKSFLRGDRVCDVNLEINYFRPSFFGLEAEIEITALAATFPQRILDPQVAGMGDGPYTPEGLLRGWNAGNAYGVRTILSEHIETPAPCLPAEKLHDSWKWNYRRAQRQEQAGEAQFVPMIMYFKAAGAVQTAAVWPEGMPAILPRVDAFLIARTGVDAAGRHRQVFCLAPWREVSDTLVKAGIPAQEGGFDVNYAEPPSLILAYIAALSETNLDDITKLSPDKVLDEDLVRQAGNRPPQEIDAPMSVRG